MEKRRLGILGLGSASLASAALLAAASETSLAPSSDPNTGRNRSIRQSDEERERLFQSGQRRVATAYRSGDPLAAERAAHNAAVEQKKRDKHRAKLDKMYTARGQS